jgi:hypothetical protein
MRRRAIGRLPPGKWQGREPGTGAARQARRWGGVRAESGRQRMGMVGGARRWGASALPRQAARGSRAAAACAHVAMARRRSRKREGIGDAARSNIQPPGVRRGACRVTRKAGGKAAAGSNGSRQLLGPLVTRRRWQLLLSFLPSVSGFPARISLAGHVVDGDRRRGRRSPPRQATGECERGGDFTCWIDALSRHIRHHLSICSEFVNL